MAYSVARALGVEVGSSLAGGDGQFGHVRGAAWSTLTRHLSPARTGSAAERLGTRRAPSPPRLGRAWTAHCPLVQSLLSLGGG